MAPLIRITMSGWYKCTGITEEIYVRLCNNFNLVQYICMIVFKLQWARAAHLVIFSLHINCSSISRHKFRHQTSSINLVHYGIVILWNRWLYRPANNSSPTGSLDFWQESYCETRDNPYILPYFRIVIFNSLSQICQ